MGYIIFMNHEFYNEYLSIEEKKKVNCQIENMNDCDIYLSRRGYKRKIKYSFDDKGDLIWLFSLLKNYQFKVEYNNKDILITFLKKEQVKELIKKKSVLNDIEKENGKVVYNIIRSLKNNIEHKLRMDLDAFHYSLLPFEKEEQVVKNYIQFCLLDKIVILNEEDMFKINSYEYEEKLNNKEINQISELNRHDIKTSFVNIRRVDLLGCYIKRKGKDDKLISELIKKIKADKVLLESTEEKKELKEEELNHVICLCIDNMEYFMEQEAFKEDFIFTLYEAVLSHELGHLVFSYLDIEGATSKERKFKERQANYFSSYVFSSELDYFINKVTKHQSSDYRNPLLLSHKLTMSNYDEQVEKLYRGEM